MAPPKTRPDELKPAGLLFILTTLTSRFDVNASGHANWSECCGLKTPRHVLKSSSEVTELLVRWSNGEAAAREALVPLVYDELRYLARHHLVNQRPDHTLQSTALVHEAYIRLTGHRWARWQNRHHFFGVAAQLMRQILVDHARKRHAGKRGGNSLTLTLDEAVALPQQREVDLVALDDALTGLAVLDLRQSQIVELRFFGGLSIEETSQVLDLSAATVKREWATARTWLYSELYRGRSTP
jgi:RNA polymerase sigma-70 factor (ECF subfamily)